MQLGQLYTHLIITVRLSSKMSSDPDFLRHFDVIQRVLSNWPYFRTKEVSYCHTWSTESIVLWPEPTVSLKFTLSDGDSSTYSPEARGGTPRTEYWCSGQSCSLNFHLISRKQVQADRGIKSERVKDRCIIFSSLTRSEQKLGVCLRFLTCKGRCPDLLLIPLADGQDYAFFADLL